LKPGIRDKNKDKDKDLEGKWLAIMNKDILENIFIPKTKLYA